IEAVSYKMHFGIVIATRDAASVTNFLRFGSFVRRLFAFPLTDLLCASLFDALLVGDSPKQVDGIKLKRLRIFYSCTLIKYANNHNLEELVLRKFPLDIFDDLTGKLVELSYEDNILVSQPCRDNTLYLLSLIDEMLVFDLEIKLPYPGSSSDFPADT
ncbi:hypothetical protein MKW98_022582, partial [Papaver atlanticum]